MRYGSPWGLCRSTVEKEKRLTRDNKIETRKLQQKKFIPDGYPSGMNKMCKENIMKSGFIKTLAIFVCFAAMASGVSCEKNSDNGSESSSFASEISSSESVNSSKEENSEEESSEEESSSITESSSEEESAEGSSNENEGELMATEGVVYALSDDGTYAKVTDYNGESSLVVMESVYEGVPVTGIADEAFFGCFGVAKVIIPDSVTSIGDRAFANCNNMTEITIPNSVKNIGREAFFYCRSLKKVVIPDSVTSLGVLAFAECYDLEEIIIPDSVASIGEEAFSYCEKLTIYCEAETIPGGWVERWNPSNCLVVWGYKGE